MIRNYYTLSKLTEELQSIRGLKIVECFSQDKSTLLFALYDGAKIRHLQFASDNRFGALFLRDNFMRARKNTIDLFEMLLGQTVKNVELARNDRIITISTNDYFVYFFLFGGSRNNLIVSDKEYTVVDSFKSSGISKGDKFVPKLPRKSYTKGDLSLMEYLSKGDFNFGKYYASEFIRREKLAGEADYADSDEMRQKLEGFRNELLFSNEFYLLQDKNGNLILSLIKLQGFEVLETFTSISKAIERRIIKELIEGNIEKERRILLLKLDKLKSKIKTSIQEIENSGKNRERAGKYRHYGELLLQCSEQKSKVGEKIVVTDFSGEKVEIKLNPKQTIIENAIYFFEKAKKAENNIKIREKMLPDLKEKLNAIVKIIEEIDEAETVKRLKKIKEENAAVFGSDEDALEGGGRFRRFELGEGYTLFVGKNAANNDDLTLHFAKPHDLWFHARGSSGSHAVLRLGKDNKPPKYILKKAAAIAAYYSGAKKAKYVPVSYTFKKYVHKPKGANPGSVVIRREEVIMVEPQLPDAD